MKTDLERYKFNTLITVVIIAYSAMHCALNGVYVDTPLEKLMTFEVHKPYVYRVLMPGIASFLHPYLSSTEIFFLLEVSMVTLLFFSTQCLFKLYVKEKEALLFSLLFFMFISMTFLINYRYGVEQPATFFFPYDTPALAFTMLGLYLVLTQRFSWLYLLVFFATLNRETSLLVILMLPALYVQTKVRWTKPFIISLIIYCLIRLLIVYLFRFHEGRFMELNYQGFQVSHLRWNMFVLINKQYILWFMAELAFMPMLWFAFSQYIPPALSRLRFIVLAYVIGLFIVGNIIEGRIFGESVALMYCPIMMGIRHWLVDKSSLTPQPKTLSALLEQYAAPAFSLLALIIGILIYRHPNHGLGF